jgi:hypothetical protein
LNLLCSQNGPIHRAVPTVIIERAQEGLVDDPAHEMIDVTLVRKHVGQ